ncbi:DNA helicase MCM9 [Antennarius striatus]|uniref:DNA helicase MCM9 n=1 Tax=Antennarius striatus TaxID=241820 RepID=UPI0035B4CE4A
MNPEQEALIVQVFDSYLKEHHHGDIMELIEDTNEESHRPVVVNAMTLFEDSMEVGDFFMAYPSDVLSVFDKVLHRKAVEFSQKASSSSSGGDRMKETRLKFTPHARITGLPVCPELTRDTIPRSRDVGRFLSVTGTVIRTSVTKVLEYEREFMCTKCHHVFTVQADFDQFCTFARLACPKPDGCNSIKFSCLSGGSDPAACRDYQEIKLQEQVQRLSVGSIPRSVVVVLEDDLVDSCKSGDDVTVYGVILQRWKPLCDGGVCEVELVLRANSMEVNNQQTAAALVMKDVHKEFQEFWSNYRHDPIAGRNQILLSLCPQVFGMYLIKLAVALVLAGGVQRIDSSGTKTRGECHLLLVGDPGTGKSQFLKYAAKITPRSVLTAGIGSTSAGLTVAAVKDGGDWHLEAGALVLSDGGLCCIDEFNSIKEHDRISIHEAMEQQSISVAKAGMVCKLNTRTTILAATNPKGQYDPREPLSVNVALASPLLSRFDLVLVLMDTKNPAWDQVVSSFILEDRGQCIESSSLWTMEKMKAYFSVVKHLKPRLCEEANSILTRYYQIQRQSHARHAARTTIRMLESLSRLAEAHAKLMFRETVTIEDAVMAVSVMECSMQGGALLGDVNALLTSFPADPVQQYQSQCQVLLEGLNLPMLLEKEMRRLSRLESKRSDGSPTAHRPGEEAVTTKHCPDSTSNHSGDGLNWFYSCSPSLPPDKIESPVMTSTQESLQRKSASTWSEMSPVSKPSNDQNEDGCLNPRTGTMSSAAEELDIMKKKENMDYKNCITKEESNQPGIQKDKESFGCVFQKVSKKLRDRRLRELEMRHQHDDEEVHSARPVSKSSCSTNVTEITTAESQASSSLLSGKMNVSMNTLDNLSSSKKSVFTKDISTVLEEAVGAEAEISKALDEKLSGFKFKAKKMKPLVPNDNLKVAFETDYNPDGNKESRTSEPGHDWHEDAHRSEQNQTLSKGGRKRTLENRVLEGGDFDFMSDELDSADFTSGREVLRKIVCRKRIKGNDKTEVMCQPERPKVNTDDETKTQSSTLKPPKQNHTKSTVTMSTLAKLSRFSFTCTDEPMVEVQTNMLPPTREDQSPHMKACDWSGENYKDKTTYSVNSRSGENVHRYKLKDEVILPPPRCPTSTCGDTERQPTASVDPMNRITPQNDPTGSLLKRKCFELVHPTSRVGTSKGPSSGLSLFDLGHDVLDTNWDQELSKSKSEST